MPVSPDATLTAPLMGQLQALPQPHQRLLSLLALTYTPLDEVVIAAILRQGDEEGFHDLGAILTALREQGLLSKSNQCHPLLTEILARQAIEDGLFVNLAEDLRQLAPRKADSTPAFFVRDMRLALYAGDFDQFNQVFLDYYEKVPRQDLAPLTRILYNPFSPAVCRSLPLHLRLHGLRHIVADALVHLLPLAPVLAFIDEPENFQEAPEVSAEITAYLKGLCLLQQDDLTGLAAEQLSPAAGDALPAMGLAGFIAFRQGKNAEAIRLFDADLRLLQKLHGKGFYFTGQEGVIYLLALLKSNDFTKLEEIISLAGTLKKGQPDSPYLECYLALEQFCRFRQASHSADISPPPFPLDGPPLAQLMGGLATLWSSHRLSQEQALSLSRLGMRARGHGFSWLAKEFNILAEAGGSDGKAPLAGLAGLLPREELWQRSLHALSALSKKELAELSQPQERLVWLINPQAGGMSINPRLQKRASSGASWSKGRALSLARLAKAPSSGYLRPEDRPLLATLSEREKDQSKTSYFLGHNEALLALIDHPLLFLAEDYHIPVQINKGEPELRISQTNEKLHLQLLPRPGLDRVTIIQEEFNRFKVVSVNQEHRRLAAIIGADGLLFPLTARDQLQQTLDSLATPLVIFSEVDPATTAQVQEANSKIVVQLSPSAGGFRLAMLVRPFGAEGPTMAPGQGARVVIASLAGQRFQVCRDLAREEQNCLEVIAHCPSLRAEEHDNHQWDLARPELCLTILEELAHLKGVVRVEWPQGSRLAVSSRANLHNLQVATQKQGNWFGLTGKLQFDQDKVMDLRQLINLVRNQQSRFIPLADGQFLALSKSLRRQITSLTDLVEQQEKLQVSPFAAPLLANLAGEGAQVEGDVHWQQLLARIGEAGELDPALPQGLTPHLRDYQLQGYKWLARLAHWGGGGCLADDMGLGKTVQSLALLLQQGTKGPSLVVAPTSVCGNWLQETRSFAPRLSPQLFGPGDRAQMLAQLQPFDLVITSYALLQQESQLFADHEWQVVILDEAQAIKNRATKRSSAAMGLKGRCRIITTGTPIENHLGELWNLFQFINPGLLGSLRQFNRNFAIPISRHQDPAASERLKAILRPFILRRLKKEVMSELPPRTEIILKVEMEEEEALMYEALRQEAVQRIASEESSGQRTIQILAEITRLRLASCHPRLVHPESLLAGAKLALFAKVVAEILENDHKALIFSQFVRHLQIIRSYLDEQQISYQYLDGATPAAKRDKAVADFQGGAGDLFLISLKAGGTGLNLTQADYVIHMDPWWNPAVEDQASDRAHRIGQTRSVTIYRLVTANTIEEKIVDLHQSKKELAESLLTGHGTGAKLDAEKLLELLKDSGS
ncbi:MAG: DEAD/DEAH box helicase [Thermodesulfobacteriota bacterium]